MRPFQSRLPLLALAAAVLAAGTAYAAKAEHPRQQTVSRAQAQTMAQDMFARLDINKDGKLDPADRVGRQAAMFDAIDADHNGQLSRDEFAAHHAGRMQADGDQGGMPMRHGRMHHGRRGHMGDRGHPGMMMLAGQADTDKDGAISQAEFGAAALQHFDRADADKDGSVTPEERRAAHAAMRDHMRMMDSPKVDGPMPAAPKAP